MQLKNQYFPEIDGLRGLAVALILIFHAGFQWLPGGFFGVDVFFVISGYLITRQILRQISEERFTFSEFYVRRIRRLVPAILVTIAGTLILGFAILSLSEFKRLGPMSMAALFGFSNFYFSGKVDYFSNEAAADPLLHFWSLAVEEQFYLVAPLVILLSFSRYSFRGVLSASSILLLVSFLLAVLFYDEMTRSVFFWPFFRAWEFALGGMLIWCFQPGRLSSIFFTLSGVALIVFSALFFTAATGGWAVANLIPCVGAALVILAADNPAKRMIFGNQISVALGRISYSLYLVHWPIIVYILYVQSGDHLTAANKVLAISLSFVAAYLLYKFVEQRFRYLPSTTKFADSRHFLVRTSACLLVLAVLSMSIALSSGWQWRLSTDVVQNGEGYGTCRKETLCTLGEVDKLKQSFDLILVGDSHARHLAAGAQAWAERTGKTVLVASSPSCVPIADVPLPNVNTKDCAFLRKELPSILDKNPSATVAVAQNWLSWKTLYADLLGYSKLLQSRDDGSVLLIGQAPKLPEQKTGCGTMHSFLLPEDACSSFPRRWKVAKINRKLANFAKRKHYEFANPQSYLCIDKQCAAEIDGFSVYIDRQHISKKASELLVEHYFSRLRVNAPAKIGE